MISSAFADDSVFASKRDSVTVFPPITQTLGYTYSKALTKPVSSPATGTLAQVPISPPITEQMGSDIYSRPLHNSVH